MYEGLELENRCDLDLSLTHRLTPDEVEVLMDTRDMFENGYMYRMNQYYCKTCLGHDSNRPIHLEFDPFAWKVFDDSTDLSAFKEQFELGDVSNVSVL